MLHKQHEQCRMAGSEKVTLFDEKEMLFIIYYVIDTHVIIEYSCLSTLLTSDGL